jgi:hypothetical protein
MRVPRLGQGHVRRAYEQLSCQNWHEILGSGYVPDSERTCVDHREKAGRGTRKLRKGQKDEEANVHHDCDSTVQSELERRRYRPQ